MKHSEIVTRLSEMVQEAGSQKAVADKLGISPSYLWELLRGTRTPGPRVLEALGLERSETTYRKANHAE